MDDVADRLWGGEKYVLGPMVRACSLPLRLACLEYGADSVYSEEIPAYRVVNCRRYENSVLNTVDFVRGKGNDMEVLFRTHMSLEKEPQRCILQLGTSDSISALKAAKIFEGDVAAIDVNMGCPKHYSVSLGKGAELMLKPETAEDIVKTLRRNCNIPISVKTRLYGAAEGSDEGGIDVNKSIEWVRRLQSAGAHAVCVHFRTPAEKNNCPAHGSLYPVVRDAVKGCGAHFVYNGDIWTREDIDCIRGSHTSEDGSGGCFMLSRAALWDPSVFSTLRRSSSPVPLLTLLSRLVSLSAETANCALNTRYLLQQVLAGHRQLHCTTRQHILKTFTLSELSTSAIANCESFVTAERQRQETAWGKLREELSAAVEASPAPVTAEDRVTAKLKLRALKFSRVSNSPSSWPGIVALTSHQYNDSYFDDNYYTAFRRTDRPSDDRIDQSNTMNTSVVGEKKRSFAYAQFSTTTITTAAAASTKDSGTSVESVYICKQQKL